MRLGFISIWGILVVASLAWADGDAPMRPMNIAEASAFKVVQSTIKSALPPPAEGVSVSYTGFDKKDIAEGTSSDRMARMLFNAQYVLTTEKRESSMQQMQMDLIKGNADQQAKMAALGARAEELKKARKVAKSLDEKARIREELKKINAEENALTDEIASSATAGLGKALRAVDNALPPKEMSTRFLVNQEVNISDSARSYQVPGVAEAFEQSDECQEGGYCVTLLLGKFESEKRISGSTRYNLHDSGGTVPTKARGMAVIVNGPKEKKDYVQNFVKQINTAKLKALLK